jgi:hypothetical protein
MAKRTSHLRAASRHGRRALSELRHMTADSALYWVLSHRSRVAQFRRAVKGTRAARPFDQLLQRIRDDATAPRKPVARKRRVRAKARRRAFSRFPSPPFLIG